MSIISLFLEVKDKDRIDLRNLGDILLDDCPLF
jgi:hypothetical protein